jgi:glycosyltransferase involved in cell wall biosynthesis
MPPVRTGVAAYSAEIVAALRGEHQIDVFTDQPAPGAYSAHDFLWKHHRRPYDLPVYQLGNSSFHDYIWPYLFRHPGLTVLHDTHLHHARAAQLLRSGRAADYRDEFQASYAPREMAELAVKGFDSYLYYYWPMRKLVVEVSRVTALHAVLMADAVRDESPTAIVETIRLAHGEPIEQAEAERARRHVRTRHGLGEGDVVFGVFGALTPEKRLPQILDAFAETRRYAPHARLMLAGATAEHYDLAGDIERRDLSASVVQTGYLPDSDLTGHLASCDVSINLRWPTAREMSGPWLRALAVGCPTIVADLVHSADVPSLDPRTWTPLHARAAGQPVPEPIAVSIDILDEAHSLQLAMRRLALDRGLRARLGAAAAEFWQREHSMERMLDDYTRVIARALESRIVDQSAAADWPRHLTDRGDRLLNQLLGSMGVRL